MESKVDSQYIVAIDTNACVATSASTSIRIYAQMAENQEMGIFLL